MAVAEDGAVTSCMSVREDIRLKSRLCRCCDVEISDEHKFFSSY